MTERFHFHSLSKDTDKISPVLCGILKPNAVLHTVDSNWFGWRRAKIVSKEKRQGKHAVGKCSMCL